MGTMYCRRCGKQLHASSRFCTQCGAATGEAGAAGEVLPEPLIISIEDNTGAADPALRYLLPIGRSGWAIASGYLALCSFFLIPALLALLCGIMAVRDLNLHPEKTGMPRAIFGILLGGLGTVLRIWL